MMDTHCRRFMGVCFIILMLVGAGFGRCEAAKGHSPMRPFQADNTGIQNLVYGRSSFREVQNAIGRSPDEIVRSEQMFPIVENYYYYEEQKAGETKTGAATVFVFENNILAGLHYKSANNQYIDLTYLLPDLGDRNINNTLLGGFQQYYFNPQFYTFGR